MREAAMLRKIRAGDPAGLEELMTLKGVGESRARAIIEYREQQGAFETPEDIMNISGIKEGVFSKIKDQIAVR